MSTTPISDYALLSDRHSAALVSKDGSIDWLCFPRFDSSSVFAALLDKNAGHWSIRPASEYTVTRHYLDPTMVLKTTFDTPTGRLTMTDALATGHTDNPHRLGGTAPRLLIRSLHCERGIVDVQIDFRPRPEYGLVVPLLFVEPGGIRARGGSERLALSSPVEMAAGAGAAAANIAMRAGHTAQFALHRSPLSGPIPRFFSQDEIGDELNATIDAWTKWSRLHQNYDGPWRDLVMHSGRVLQALSYEPTGAIIAAPTTSLPETIGGERNWDYRYAWIRDASFTMQALWVAACPDEASEFFDYMASAAASYQPEHALQIMFGIGGEHDLSERELAHLSGWHDSRPVRVGNDAWTQHQIDVYGELLGAAHLFTEILGEPEPHLRRFFVSLVNAAMRVWPEADHGIWEIRGEPRHFTYSKLMCWVALDRAIKLAGKLDADEHVDDWVRVRNEIRAVILEQGWSDTAHAFTQSFGSDALDASVLMMPIVGFIPADDPRMLATITTIAEQLTDGRGLVYRYHTHHGVDGLAGDEGTFLLCTFWLARAQALAGRLDEARATFERAIANVNDVGLLAEEVDPATGALLGNFPQAFSHIGLINAAWTIGEQEGRGATTPGTVQDAT